ncbi:sodium/glucose cotransporter 5-like [Mya arenaria]|uniref:sodium/glucose cotransporter 5-like n=1 Tax=Mya arenaria TaxID=6604 RepID=UPI0022E4F9CD|nr:sodium/glucose cotransporter 5-like [Mya arenaria]
MAVTGEPGIQHWADILIIVVYFIIVLGVGLWTLVRPHRGNVENYFLAGRNMPWFAVGASLFSSNIGSEHFVGLAGAGAAAGIALILFEWFPIFLILLLGWVFIPVYVSAGVYTLPEYIERRHGGHRIRLYLSCVSIVLYVLTKLASSMFAGSLFIQMALQWNTYLSLAVLLAITTLYTMLGGLTAVMYTDTFQTVVMVIGSTVVMILSFIKIGGYANLERLYFNAVASVRSDNASTCGLPRADAFHVFQDAVTGDQPWPGLVLQASLGCLWYWCCDQVIVQRSLAARSLTHAKGGSMLAGSLKILPLFLLIFPGMISRILYPDDVACVDPKVCQTVCDNPAGCSNIAYPKLVLELLPVGARGLLMAVMLSAIMSSLTSIFNSASTVFTMDIWRRVRPNAAQRELLIVGRLFVLVMCVLAILWVPMVKAFQGGRLFSYMVAVEGYIGSPLGVLFLLSIFWRRTTEAGAFFGLVLGHLLGVSRLVVELVYPAPPCGEMDTRPHFLSRLHFTYFVQIQLLFTGVMIVAISVCTKPRSPHQLEGVTWWTKITATADDDNDMEMSESYSHNTRKPQLSEIAKDPPLLLRVESRVGARTSYARTVLERIKMAVCGVTDDSQADEKIVVEHIKTFLYQTSTAKNVLNASAIALVVAVAFLTGFYH